MNRSPINLLSPIGLMPFGPEKGTPIWQLSIGTVEWLWRQNLTDESKETLEAAWGMFMHEGQYAVLRRDENIPAKVSLVCIVSDYCDAYLKWYNSETDFIYCLSSRKYAKVS